MDIKASQPSPSSKPPEYQIKPSDGVVLIYCITGGSIKIHNPKNVVLPKALREVKLSECKTNQQANEIFKSLKPSDVSNISFEIETFEVPVDENNKFSRFNIDVERRHISSLEKLQSHASKASEKEQKQQAVREALIFPSASPQAHTFTLPTTIPQPLTLTLPTTSPQSSKGSSSGAFKNVSQTRVVGDLAD